LEELKGFDKIIMEAIEEGLAVLGKSGKQTVYFHLENNCSIKKQEIPQKLEAFAKGLENMFGVGAIVLENLIIRSLYSKLGIEYEEIKDYEFIDYLKHAKKVELREENKDCRNCSSNNYIAEKSSGRTAFQKL
jgi:hypothetical protein